MGLFGKLLKSKKEPEEKKEVKGGKVHETVKTDEIGGYGGLLRSFHVTEKSGREGALNKYSFRVENVANKTEVKKAVERKFGVNVLRVNILNIKSKKVMLGRITGRSPGYKKAVVTLAAGQKIETGV